MHDYFVIDAGLNPVPQETRGWQQKAGGQLTWTSSDSFGAPHTHVSETDALSYSPIFTGISLISGDISGMPWRTKRVEDDGDIVDADDHSTFDLLLKRTGGNEDFTANLFVEAMIARAIFYGLGVARIHRGGPLHRPNRLELIRSRVTPVDRQSSGKRYRFYEWTDEFGQFQQKRPDDLLILPGPTIDAFHGMGLYDYARATIRQAKAASEYSRAFFEGKGVPKGFFIHPGEMSDEAQTRFRQNMDRFMADRSNYAILEEDTKWVQSGIRPVDAAMVDLLQLTAADVSRFLKIPPSKLGVQSERQAPAKSTEQEQKNYLSSCLFYWINRLQSEADDKLFREDEKATYFTKFDTSEWIAMAAGSKERAETDRIDVLSGVRTINEARKGRGLNKHANGVGDKALLPLNSTTNPAVIDEGGDSNAGGIEPATDGDTTRTRKPMDIHAKVLARDLGRVVKRLGVFASKAAKVPSTYLGRIDSLRDDHGSHAHDVVEPICELIACELQRDSRSTAGLLLDRVFERAQDKYVQAADCQPDELETSVASANEALATEINEIALAFCKG